MLHVIEVTDGDALELERLQQTATGLRRTLARKPWLARAMRERVKHVERDIATIQRRYA